MIDNGTPPTSKRAKLNPLTFRQVSVSLEKEWQKRLDRKELSTKTVAEYRNWLKILNRAFGDRFLCHISDQAIESYRDDILKTRTNVTANKYLSIIKKVFAHGLRINGVVSDPAKEIAYLSERGHKRNRFLLPHDLDKLVEATQQTRSKFYMPAIIYLGAEHGASKQEILDLEWSNIDFEFKGTGLISLFRTKNRRERTELLMHRTKRALLDWKSHFKFMRHRKKITKLVSERVFCRLDGTPIDSFSRGWWHCLKVAGIKDFHFHDLRHTFCSNLILSGADLKDAKEMIGHADISMTDRYSHLTSQRHMLNMNDQME